MPDREWFLRAIEAEPKDDAIRLVFSDWLEENGDIDRARFIRLQCEHHRLYGKADPTVEPSHQHEIEKEINALLAHHRKAWTAGLPAWTEKEYFERGFLDIIRMTGKQFLDGAARLRAVTPIDSLFFNLLKGREEAVFASEHLSGVSRLWAYEAQVTDAGIQALTSSSHLGRVHRLGLDRPARGYGDGKDANKLTDASAIALANADNLPALTDLELSGYKKITMTGIRVLVESALRTGLKKLDISRCAAGPGVGELFRSPTCRLMALETLMLNDLKQGNEGAKALAVAATLRNLRELGLAGNKIGDRGATSLAESPHLLELIGFDLSNNNLTDAGVLAILASHSLRRVRRLHLDENRTITDVSARAILADGRLWEMVRLDGTGVSQTLRDQIAARCKQASQC